MHLRSNAICGRSRVACFWSTLPMLLEAEPSTESPSALICDISGVGAPGTRGDGELHAPERRSRWRGAVRAFAAATRVRSLLGALSLFSE
eukprot:scaffold100867_cov31-Tisochrysis_lutea.AAC.2